VARAQEGVERRTFPQLGIGLHVVVGAGAFPRKRPDRDFRLAEFFAAAPFRRSGVGRAAAEAVLGAHDGTWQLEVVDGNEPALRFWRGVLGGIPHREEPGEGDTVFLFETAR
jgi:predicted acetyltransferase